MGKESYVYLCSHNKMADEINQEKLAEIKVDPKTYEAKLTGDFKENQFPNDQFLELKIGAQIMFIRNDISGEKNILMVSLVKLLVWMKMKSRLL